MTDVIDPVEALRDVMVGGNHIASYLVQHLGPGFNERFPPTREPLSVLEEMGACDAFDVWCCWASIMRARAALTAAEAAGMVWVPKVANEEMLAQAWIYRTQMDDQPTPQKVFAKMWEVMVRAALTGPEQATREGDATP